MTALVEKLIAEKLATKQDVLGFDPTTVEQQSYEWHLMRLGVVTGSMIKKVLMGKETQGRKSYMAQLAAEIATGSPKDFGSFKQTEWGNENEPHAAETYRFVTGRELHPVPFLYSDDMRCGVSPDGIGTDRGVEIKCPFTSEVHIMTMCDNFIKTDYHWQVQYSMWVTGLNKWDFCSFDPRMSRNPLHVMEISANDKDQKTLSDAVPQFISELDRMLESIGFSWGEQWDK